MSSTPFASLALPNPRLAAEQIRGILAEHWGVDGTLEEIGSSQDQNFGVTDADGRRFVLKVANPHWRRGELDMQNRAMLHTAANADFDAPVPVPARDGALIVRACGHDVRLLTWVEGRPLCDFGHLRAPVWRALGRLSARSARALAGFEHPELGRDLQWDPRRCAEVLDALGDLVEGEPRELLGRAREAFTTVAADGAGLPVAPIHCDVTDYNTVSGASAGEGLPTGLLDFGDVVRTWRVSDVACAAVSAIAHDLDDPLGVALAVLEGYHRESALSPPEVNAFWPLVLARAAVCAISATQQAAVSPENVLAERAVVDDWAVLRALDGVVTVLGVAASRAACGLEPDVRGAALPELLARAGCAPMLDTAGAVAIDLSVGSDGLAFGAWSDARALAAAVADGAGSDGMALGRWGEIRIEPGPPGERPPATLHLGADAFAAPGTDIRAPLEGIIASHADGEMWLECRAGETVAHVRLSRVEPARAAGDRVARGDVIARVAPATRGLLPPHVHVQLCAAPGLPGMGRPRERAAWLGLCPDPSVLLGADVRAREPRSAGRERDRRERVIASPQRLYYDEPPEMVRGWRHVLYDADGRPYVDAVNNVAVVGHSHPAVVEAATRQLRLLNTNSRFLYGAMTEYAERLSGLLPAGLDRVFLVNSGSEAVDLALRLARAFTGRRDVLALQGAYHGWTKATDELCTNPIDRPGWRDELAAHVHVAEQPDPYRGRFGDDGSRYAESVRRACRAAPDGLAAFVAEPLLGNQGGVEPASGYFAAAYDAVRAAGGVCIADEVQVGYGRTGESFWAFEHEGVVPDIVCVAKAVGNGHPLGAVVCRPEIADAFDRQAPFFSSTGGSPVSCRIGLAVLDAIERDGLQGNARQTGTRLRAGFERLATQHPIIGAVHGRGLYLGVDLVRDRETREPAAAEALAICERLRDLGVIVQPTGDAFNVLKIKPPLCIDADGADHLLGALERTLGERAPRR